MSKESERVKRWREKNRWRVNAKQKEYRARKKDLSVGDDSRKRPPERESRAGIDAVPSPTAQFKKMITVEDLPEEEKKVMPMKPRFIHGMAVSEREWQRHLEKLRKAKEGGFEYDEYSQG